MCQSEIEVKNSILFYNENDLNPWQVQTNGSYRSETKNLTGIYFKFNVDRVFKLTLPEKFEFITFFWTSLFEFYNIIKLSRLRNQAE